MTTRRDIVTTGLAGAAAIGLGLPAAIRPASAQAMNNLDVFIPAAPGGGWDQTGRAIEQVLRADGLVKDFKFEHAPGAGGAVGLPKFVNTRKGRGDAIMVSGMVMIGATIANKSPVKITDTTALARLTGESEVIVVPAKSPFKTLPDLVAALKADPKKVSWAGGSAGGTDHIFAGMVARAVGVDPKQVAYVAYAGGGPAQAALLGNQVSAGVSGYGEFEQQIKAGKLRALAISAEAREANNVPTLKEQGVDVVLYNWRGVFGAPGISAEQRAALVALIEKMAKGATWKAEMEKKGWTDILLTGDAYTKYVQDEVVRITAILKDLGLTT